MLRFTLRRLAVGSFSLFMMEQKTNPALVGLSVGRRGRLLGRLYRGLSPRDRAALEKRAAAHPGFKRHPKRRKVPKPRGKTAYNRFIRKHYHDRALAKKKPSERITAIAAMWRAKNGMADPPKKAKAAARTAAKRSGTKAHKGVAAPAKKRVKSASAKHKKASKVQIRKVSPKKLRIMKKSRKLRKASPKAAKALKAKKATKASASRRRARKA